MSRGDEMGEREVEVVRPPNNPVNLGISSKSELRDVLDGIVV